MSTDPAAHLKLRVFISSVQKELEEERMQLRILLTSDPFVPPADQAKNRSLFNADWICSVSGDSWFRRERGEDVVIRYPG